jgi:hypothetical protein
VLGVMEDQVSGLGDEGEVGCPDLLMVVSVELILGLLMG